MRILNLGNSTDERLHGTVPGSPLNQICAELKRRTGDEVDGLLVRAFPNAGLAGFVQKLLDREQPDIVILHCSGYVVEAETLAHGLTRRFGPKAVEHMLRARRITRAVLQVDPDHPGPRGPSPRLRAYTAVRQRLLVAGLGNTISTIDATASAYEAMIRLVAAREDIIFLVRGPSVSLVMRDVPVLQERALQRVAALDERIQAACATRRVPFISSVKLMSDNRPQYFDPDDILHPNVAGLTLMAQAELKILLPLLGY